MACIARGSIAGDDSIICGLLWQRPGFAGVYLRGCLGREKRVAHTAASNSMSTFEQRIVSRQLTDRQTVKALLDLAEKG